MRGGFISAFTFFLSACAITESGTEEAVLFSGKNAGAAKPHVVLKPYNDLPLSIEFSCPTKIVGAMISPVYPFLPVIPVGFLNKHVSYLRIEAPEDAEYAVARIRLITRQGLPMPLPDAPKSKRVGTNTGTMEMTYTVRNDCEAFDGGFLEIAGFSYKGRDYATSDARLQFDSRIKTVVRYGPFLSTGLLEGAAASD